MSLYKIGETYFVRDDNSVSVAKYHKVTAIDAEVVELRGQMRTEAMHRAVCTARAPTSTTTPFLAWVLHSYPIACLPPGSNNLPK